jgi:hypothetical protein
MATPSHTKLLLMWYLIGTISVLAALILVSSEPHVMCDYATIPAPLPTASLPASCLKRPARGFEDVAVTAASCCPDLWPTDTPPWSQFLFLQLADSFLYMALYITYQLDDPTTSPAIE